jgi:4-carboxymuconolactone decarboxylase
MDDSEAVTPPEAGGEEADDRRRARARAMEKMEEVCGCSVDPDAVEGSYVALMVDQRFGEVWTRPALDLRDRRPLTLGALAALGQPQLMEIQCRSALDRGELTADQVRESVIHLAHYVGWPRSTGVNEAVEKVIAERPVPEER